MTIKELRKELETKKNNLNHLIDKTQKEIEKLKEQFEKKISSHFKGVEVEVYFNSSSLSISICNTSVLKYTYDKFEFNKIDRELAYKLKDLYDEQFDIEQDYHWTYGCDSSNYKPSTSY